MIFFIKKKKQNQHPQYYVDTIFISQLHNSLSISRARNASPETQNKDLRQPLPLPPMSPTHPAPKPTKKARKRPRSENGQPPATASSTALDASNHKDPSSTKQKKMVEDHSEQVKGNKVGIGY